MIKAMIVDDDPVTLNLLHMLLNEISDVDVIGAYESAYEGMASLDLVRPDVVFLDVEMPEISGIEFALEITQTDADMNVVFVSSHEHYAIEAFRLNALHYILKPVSAEMVEMAVERVRKEMLHNKPRPGVTRIECFDGIRIFDDSGVIPVKWITSKTEELFALLLLNQQQGISKWSILESIWGDCEPKKAHQNLYTTIFRLKKTFEEIGIAARLENKNGMYFMKLTDTVVDFIQFETIMEQNAQLNSDNAAIMEAYLSLYKGDLFGDRAYAWCIPTREYYHATFLERSKELLAYYLASKKRRKAVKLLNMVSGIDYDPELDKIRNHYSQLYGGDSMTLDPAIACKISERIR